MKILLSRYFFEYGVGHNLTVNEECYRNKVNDFLEPELDDIDLY